MPGVFLGERPLVVPLRKRRDERGLIRNLITQLGHEASLRQMLTQTPFAVHPKFRRSMLVNGRRA